MEVDLRSVVERDSYWDENYWNLNYRYVMLGASGKRQHASNTRDVKDSVWHLWKNMSLMERVRGY